MGTENNKHLFLFSVNENVFVRGYCVNQNNNSIIDTAVNLPNTHFTVNSNIFGVWKLPNVEKIDTEYKSLAELAEKLEQKLLKLEKALKKEPFGFIILEDVVNGGKSAHPSQDIIDVSGELKLVNTLDMTFHSKSSENNQPNFIKVTLHY